MQVSMLSVSVTAAILFGVAELAEWRRRNRRDRVRPDRTLVGDQSEHPETGQVEPSGDAPVTLIDERHHRPGEVRSFISLRHETILASGPAGDPAERLRKTV